MRTRTQKVMMVNAENQLQMLAQIMSILLYQDFKLKQRKQVTSS